MALSNEYPEFRSLNSALTEEFFLSDNKKINNRIQEFFNQIKNHKINKKYPSALTQAFSDFISEILKKKNSERVIDALFMGAIKDANIPIDIFTLLIPLISGSQQNLAHNSKKIEVLLDHAKSFSLPKNWFSEILKIANRTEENLDNMDILFSAARSDDIDKHGIDKHAMSIYMQDYLKSNDLDSEGWDNALKVIKSHSIPLGFRAVTELLTKNLSTGNMIAINGLLNLRFPFDPEHYEQMDKFKFQILVNTKLSSEIKNNLLNKITEAYPTRIVQNKEFIDSPKPMSAKEKVYLGTVGWIWEPIKFVINNTTAAAFTFISGIGIAFTDGVIGSSRLLSKVVGWPIKPPEYIDFKKALWPFGFISKLILPAQTDTKNRKELLRDKVLSSDPKLYSFTKVKVKISETFDSAELDTLEISSKTQGEKERKKQKFIINFNANATHYEDELNSLTSTAGRLKCNVIGFNYRGVGESLGTPSSKDKLVQDGIAQVQRLLSEGIPASQITLSGRSLGGSIATLVAEHFHKQGQKIYLFNDRSFSTLTKAAVGFIKSNKSTGGYKFLNKLVDLFIAPIVKGLLKLSSYEIDAASAYRSIPNTHKEYLVARGIKDVRRKQQSTSQFEDGIIHHSASLHVDEFMKQERRQLKKEINLLPLTDAQKKELKKYNKMHATNVEGGHNVRLDDLAHFNGKKTGIEFFDNFFMNQTSGASKIDRIKKYFNIKTTPAIEDRRANIELSANMANRMANIERNSEDLEKNKQQNHSPVPTASLVRSNLKQDKSGEQVHPSNHNVPKFK